MTVLSREETRVVEAYARRARPDRYSWFNAAHLYAMQEIERGMLQLLESHGFTPLRDQRILDVGCGTGVWLRAFAEWGAAPSRLTGVDLQEQRIAEARRLAPPAVRLVTGSAAELAFPDESFDIVLQSLMFTSILDQTVRNRVAGEMLRVVRPGGMILWYDYHVNNPSNADVRAVTAPELAQLFASCAIDRRRVTLAPPIARLIAPRSRSVYALLAAVPPLKTHYLAAIRRPAQPTLFRSTPEHRR
jgi:ubiquinone/menaquinone biosynthesis C-methylase UbiE